MADLLLELYSEHIPATMQSASAKQLAQLMEKQLKSHGFAGVDVATYVTPRRLVCAVEGIPQALAAKVTEKKGPKVTSASQVVEAFARGASCAVEDLEQRETDKGLYYFATTTAASMPTRDVLLPILEGVMAAMSWPKSMHWGEYTMRWVRPLISILCLFDGELLPLKYGHIEAGNTTRGHTFLAPQVFAVSNFAEYHAKLANAYVVLEQEERKHLIITAVNRLLKKQQLVLEANEGLLMEIVGLTEFPVALLGTIPERFMTLPEEVLITSLRTHQKYLCVRHEDGTLAPHFIMVADMQPSENDSTVLDGNHLVLTARLTDAQFFWDQDRLRPLASRVPQLSHVTFHSKLGSIGDKVARLRTLAPMIGQWVPQANIQYIERAAELCKTDLLTHMVGEFPELQGRMGYYYAIRDAEPNIVAMAILEHYAPLGPESSCPTRPESVALSIADKVDTLVGLFLAGEQPTSSKDPFALRRACLGVIRMILEHRLRLPLQLLLNRSFQLFTPALRKANAQVKDELMGFFQERLRAMLKASEVPHDIMQAVLASSPIDDFTLIVSRIQQLQAFLQVEKGRALVQAVKRVANIMQDKPVSRLPFMKAPKPDKFTQIEEFELQETLQEVQPLVMLALKDEDFTAALEALVPLASFIHKFFEKVIVDAEDVQVRNNRLKLLAAIKELAMQVTDFSYIETVWE